MECPMDMPTVDVVVWDRQAWSTEAADKES
jgi:hypothetical protein